MCAVLSVGDRVEVYTRFSETWSTGFEIAGVVEGGYELRRLSDGAVLPAMIPGDNVREVISGPA